MDAAKLEQNVPNPFNEKTIIQYYMPSSSKSGSIRIYSLDGGEQKIFDFSNKGYGQVELNANSLQPGTYVYHLIVDGKQIDSKLLTIVK